MALDVQAEIRREIEAMSLGQMTVRFSDKGQPSYFHRLKKFQLEDIHPTLFGTGTHPAFIVGGNEVDEVLIGTQAAVDIDGEGLSQAGRAPRVSRTHDQSVTMMRGTGAGFSVVTNAMYAAVALQIWKGQQYPRGNTNYGRHSVETGEYGLRPDGDPAIGGNVNGNTVVLTGTGPNEWNWPRNPFGIQGLTGNVWEWAPGMRIVDGEIQIIKDNDAILHGTDLAAASAEWFAIDRTDGSLVAPGSSGTIHYAESGTADGTLVIGSSGSIPISSLTPYGISESAMQLLRSLALMSPDGASGMLGDRFYHSLSGERMPRRGGHWGSGSDAGPFAVRLNSGRSYVDTLNGFRPAFVI